MPHIPRLLHTVLHNASLHTSTLIMYQTCPSFKGDWYFQTQLPDWFCWTMPLLSSNIVYAIWRPLPSWITVGTYSSAFPIIFLGGWQCNKYIQTRNLHRSKNSLMLHDFSFSHLLPWVLSLFLSHSCSFGLAPNHGPMVNLSFFEQLTILKYEQS